MNLYIVTGQQAGMWDEQCRMEILAESREEAAEIFKKHAGEKYTYEIEYIETSVPKILKVDFFTPITKGVINGMPR